MSPRAEPTNRDEIVGKLFKLFRSGGYEGVSVGDISKATGLGKSSLYHHFPGGKADMAAAVVDFARAWLRQRIFEPLATDAPLAVRVDDMLKAAHELYGGGTAPCLIASMMLSNEDKPGGVDVGQLMNEWIAALSSALQENGLAKAAAADRATSALIGIEGALLVARATGRLKVFEKALRRVREDLLAA
ncbi:MAG: TetR/AcrR family transcriptional regulator [Proteobacteria bacterium]|nr:TetR/AcrR family transcriptional regulator [Pseudomonadota bacterium]